MTPRDAVAEDTDALTALWFEGWQEAHAAHAPPAYRAFRTRENFAARVPELLTRIRTLGPVGAPLGLHIVQDNELYQFYVAPQARGSGAAQILLADAETAMARTGADNAFLFVLPQNPRAIRFYAKAGWSEVGIETVQMPLETGSVGFDLTRMEKRL